VDTTLISDGSVNLVSDATVLQVTLSGGTLTGTGDLTATSALMWTGGTLSGDGVTTGGLKISGAGQKTLSGRTLNNVGLASWTGTGGLTVNGGGVLDNLAGSTFLIENDAVLGGGPGVFRNEGAVRKQDSDGTSVIAIPFVNTGTVEVLSGVLLFTAGDTPPPGAGAPPAVGAGVPENGGPSVTADLALSVVSPPNGGTAAAWPGKRRATGSDAEILLIWPAL
jgi:hypothetical protein